MASPDDLRAAIEAAVCDWVVGNGSVEGCTDAVLAAIAAHQAEPEPDPMFGIGEGHYRGLDWDDPDRADFCGNCMEPWPCPSTRAAPAALTTDKPGIYPEDEDLWEARRP